MEIIEKVEVGHIGVQPYALGGTEVYVVGERFTPSIILPAEWCIVERAAVDALHWTPTLLQERHIALRRRLVEAEFLCQRLLNADPTNLGNVLDDVVLFLADMKSGEA